MSTTVKGTALVTGASSGIGAVYADRLARRGYDLVLVARDQARMEATATRLRAETGRSVEVLPADLAVPAKLAMVQKRIDNDPSLTLLVNNAGISLNGSVLENGPAEFERLIAVNITAPTVLASAAAKAFVQRRNGTIINIASVLALAPEALDGVYSGSKAFILNLSVALAEKVRNAGVHVQAVLPGATRTEIWERAGVNISNLPPEMLMDVEEMVDAALSGLDQNEAVTIPSLPDIADWQKLNEARFALGPNLSRNHPAARYGQT
jgi:uncharacterized protein